MHRAFSLPKTTLGCVNYILDFMNAWKKLHMNLCKPIWVHWPLCFWLMDCICSVFIQSTHTDASELPGKPR